jgi:hypothetical protein
LPLARVQSQFFEGLRLPSESRRKSRRIRTFNGQTAGGRCGCWSATDRIPPCIWESPAQQNEERLREIPLEDFAEFLERPFVVMLTDRGYNG